MTFSSARRLGAGIVVFLSTALAQAQSWDLGARTSASVSKQTEGVLKVTLEQRGRYERRTGQSFGSAPDLESGLIRTRVGVAIKPNGWLKITANMQDSRAPWYGVNAPNNVRDEADLFEGAFELFADRKTGFGFSAGRKMLNYGDTRLIGSPQWGNLARSFDHARAYYKVKRAQVEFLFASPVKIRNGEFNRPVLGDRVWGVYNVFPELIKKGVVEAYALRHEQNRPGGFTSGKEADGTDHLGVNTFGGRITGPAPSGAKYVLEGALQTGRVGTARHRAAGWVTTVSRRWKVAGRTLDLLGEYKFASGSKNPADTAKTGTFDQIYASGHDKFGHQDLFGWRNIHNARSMATLALSKSVSLNGMYDNYWLASLRDGLYNGSGKSIARSANGTAGRHVGQETDIFLTWKYQHFTFGAGYGYLFTGQFLNNTTPGVNPSYAYLFHTYSF